MFKKTNGGRTKVPNLIIVITDSPQTKVPGATHPKVIADHLRSKGIQVITVGIGKKVVKKELDKISNNTSLLTKNFTTLLSNVFVNNVTAHVCTKIVPKSK